MFLRRQVIKTTCSRQQASCVPRANAEDTIDLFFIRCINNNSEIMEECLREKTAGLKCLGVCFHEKYEAIPEQT